MNDQHNNKVVGAEDSPENTREKLLELLRARLAQLSAHTPENDTPTFKKVEKEHRFYADETTGNQPLIAGTPPGTSRDDAEMPAENPTYPAGTNPNTSHKRSVTESPLDELPPDVQAVLLRLLEEHTLEQATLRITTKPPYGMGIATSRSSLHRFLQRHRNLTATRHRQQIAAETAKLVSASISHGDLSSTAGHLIELRLLEAAASERADAQNLLALSRSLDRIRAIDQAERRLRLLEQKSKTTQIPQPAA